MAATPEEALRPEQRSGALVKIGKSPWVVWRFTQKAEDTIGIEALQEHDGQWHGCNGTTAPVDAMFAVGDILADIEAGKPAPAIADKKLANLEIDQWTKHIAKWIVPVKGDKVLAVYDYVYDGTPSVMLRTYLKKKAMRIHSYSIIDKVSAFELGKHIRAMRG